MLLPDFRGGGAEKVSIDLAREFVDQGHEVEFVLMRAVGDFIEEAGSICSVVDLGVAKSRHVPRALACYLRARQPEALIANLWPLTVVAPVAARIAGYRGRLVICEHNSLSTQYAAWGLVHRLALRSSAAIGYRLADIRIGVSQGVADDMARLSGISDSLFISVVHNPVRRRPQPSEFQLSAAENLWAQGSPRILTVGSLKDQKNHILLLRAFAKMEDQPEAKLMLLGHGKNEAMLRSLAFALGIADRVIFAGFHADPTSFYYSADLFVLSSDYEGFGNVIVEALSCGLPVVSTDCHSGPSEILENGRYGRLVPVGDTEALAKAMSEALSTPYNRDDLTRRAADFGPEIAAQRYLSLMGCS